MRRRSVADRGIDRRLQPPYLAAAVKAVIAEVIAAASADAFKAEDVPLLEGYAAPLSPGDPPRLVAVRDTGRL